MDIVEWFGGQVGRLARENPARARALLAAGWRAQLLKLTAAPDRRLPPSRRYMARFAMSEILRALTRPERAAAVSVFAPSEALLAAGLSPLSVEQMSCFLAGSRAEAYFMEMAGDAGFSDTMCSYHRVYLGALSSGLMPRPACVVYTSLACDGNMVTFPYLARRLGAPSYCIDVPFERSEEAVAEVARQIRGLVAFLGEVTGRPVSEERLRENVARGWRGAQDYRRFLAASPGRRLPSDMVSEMYAFLTNHVVLGSPEAARFCSLLADEMARAPRSAGIRLVWVHTMPFSQAPLVERLNFNDRSFVTACDMAADPMLIDIDPAKPYDAMARRLVYSCFNGSADVRAARAVELARMTEADGAVVFCHWGCKTTLGAARLIKDRVEEAGVPCLVLDGDGVDPSKRADGQASTRMGAFLEMLEARR